MLGFEFSGQPEVPVCAVSDWTAVGVGVGDADKRSHRKRDMNPINPNIS